MKKIKSALVSVYYKDGLDELIHTLAKQNVVFYSTGGTQAFIEKLGFKVIPVEELTAYPSILGGRVKTLHPKVFGGILARRENPEDIAQLSQYQIPKDGFFRNSQHGFSEHPGKYAQGYINLVNYCLWNHGSCRDFNSH